MKKEQFIQASTRVRVMETRLLKREQFERMIAANHIDEVFRVLNETGYANSFSKLSRPEDYEEALSAELLKLYKDMKEISPVKEVIDFAALKYDAHNLKVLFKDFVMGKRSDDLLIPIGRIDLVDLMDRSEEGNRKAIDQAYDNIASDIMMLFEDTTDPQTIELVVDLHYYETLLKTAKKMNYPPFLQYAKDMIDFDNVKMVFRMKKQGRDVMFLDKTLIEGGEISVEKLKSLYYESIETIITRLKNVRIGEPLLRALKAFEETGRLSEFERSMDDYQMNFAKEAKTVTYGPEVILSYIMAKETEIKNLRIIIVSKLNKLPPEFIRGRLRDIYV